MCEPITLTTGLLIASVTLAAAGTAMSIHGQRQQAETQAGYQRQLVEANQRQMAQNRELATDSFLAQTAQEYVKLKESREATGAAIQDKAIEGQAARAKVLTAAAEAGVDGVSLTGLLNDFHRQEATFGLRYNTNLEYRTQQTDFNVATLEDQAKARILGTAPYIPAPIKPVDYFGPIATGVQQGVNSYSNKLYYDKLGTRPLDNANLPTSGSD
jgi:hypothetical protein